MTDEEFGEEVAKAAMAALHVRHPNKAPSFKVGEAFLQGYIRGFLDLSIVLDQMFSRRLAMSMLKKLQSRKAEDETARVEGMGSVGKRD
jgi:hypothetical protein